MSDNIDPERLISLVENHPVIWDKTLDEYKDKVKTLAAWREICTQFEPNFESLPEENRKEIGFIGSCEKKQSEEEGRIRQNSGSSEDDEEEMNNSVIKGIRRKKSSLTEIKVAVIGAPGVGKSALIVRFLTRRYIGEYVHEGDIKYKHEVMVDGEPILFEVMDMCPKSLKEYPTHDVYQWADAMGLVYSITDRDSFDYVKQMKPVLDACSLPVVLVANKADMVHLRQVSTEEGDILAKDFECPFSEVTAAEQVMEVADIFNELCREVLSLRRKNKQSLLDRMLGNKPSTPVRTYARGKSDSALPKE